ncbi:MAG: CDP-alcohol phosphatidyltransferase family protein [Micromonosporaceae bacterium]|nr:CDP-alcohol phosphatidyltransferase family protein [Micromonosporaceae bacterium]
MPRPAHDTRAQPPVDRPPAAPPAASSNRVLTVPNLISFARLLGVPVFLYLFLGPQADVAAIVVLAVGGTSDWIDGYVARRLRQVSRIGELLDPLADRLYILATLAAFTLRDVVPWPFTAALLLRELVVAAALAALRRYGYVGLPVHYLGKTATFILLFAFPVLLLAHSVRSAADVAGAVGWALAWWGIVLYWAAGVLYLVQAAGLIRASRHRERTAGPAQGQVRG